MSKFFGCLVLSIFSSLLSIQGQNLELVDLGLSVKWANCNVNAVLPQDNGIYCGWGDPTGKRTAENLDDYPYSSVSISGTQMDVATRTLGKKWRIPTMDEVEELKSHCLWLYTQKGGVRGYKVIGPNHNSIFLPIRGYRKGDVIYDNVPLAFYCIGTGSSHQYERQTLKLDSCNVALSSQHTELGVLIRPVENTVKSESAKSIEYYPLTDAPWVDLNLSIKWSNTNLGAAQPEDFGNSCEWGELSKGEFSGKTIKRISGIESDQFDSNALISNMRLPTYDEFSELRNHCTWVKGEYKGVQGYRIVGRNGNNIFLPIAGVYWGEKYVGYEGFYWTSTKFAIGAYALLLRNDVRLQSAELKCAGSIRPVLKK